MEFKFGNFRDGEIKFAKTELDGFTVEFQGWNSESQPYDTVIIIKDGEIKFTKDVRIDNVRSIGLSEVKRLIEEAFGK